jgi:hypothetical protein
VASERQSPDAILASTNLTGSVSDIQDDPDSPDSNWLTATSDGSDTMLRVSFPTPTGDPTTGAGLQEFRWWVRNTANAGGSDPTYVIHLYENGSDLGQIASGSVASGTGEIISATWNASSLGTSDGSLVEAYIYGTVVKKDSLEIGAVEWNVTYDTGTTHEGQGASDGTSTAGASANVDHTGIGASDGTSTAGASGNVDHTGVGASDGTSTASATGTTGTTHEGQGASDGTSTAAATAEVIHTGAGASDGTSTAGASANVDHTGAGASDGIATVAGVGNVDHTGVGVSDGTSTAGAVAEVDHTGQGASDGTSTAGATANVDHTGVGASDGTSTAGASANVVYAGAGASDGTSTASASGHVAGIQEGAGASDGTSTAAAAGSVVYVGAGQSDGIATATATGAYIWVAAAQSDGTSTASASGAISGAAIIEGAGQSDGVATVTAIALVGVVTNVPWLSTTKMGVHLRNGPAPAGGAVFSLSIKSGETARITFPATVTLSSGDSGKQFDVTWAIEGATILEAQLTEYDGGAVTGTVFERDVYCLPPSTEKLITLTAEVDAETSPTRATVEVGS